MRALSAAWRRALTNPRARKVLLATISPNGFEANGRRHLGYEPHVIRAATDAQVHVPSDLGPLPYFPTLLTWPALTRTLSIRERRWEIAEVTLSIARGAALAGRLLDAGGGYHATVRLDLWSDGIALDDTLLLFAGPVREVPKVNDRAESVQVVATEGDPSITATWADGTITPAEFPDAPDALQGFGLNYILGTFSQPVPCPQIDAKGLRFVICAGTLNEPPTTVARNGVPITMTWSVVNELTPAKRPVSVLVLKEPANTIGDGGFVTDEITCAGGVGIGGKHPARMLLEDVCGLTLTARARTLLDATPFDLELLANVTGDALKLVRERVLPQTNLMFGFEHGQVDLIPLGPTLSRRALRLGAGLRYRPREQPTETLESAIANQIVVQCGRAVYGGVQTSVVRSAARSVGTLRRRLQQSLDRYGAKPLVYDAPDLPLVQRAAALSCPLGEVLASHVAACYALPATPHRYAAEWLDGMTLELADGAQLTDADQQLDAVDLRVSGWELPGPEGPVLTMEADPWA